MKHERKRVVLDTNTIISGVIRPQSIPADVLRKALLECDVFSLRGILSIKSSSKKVMAEAQAVGHAYAYYCFLLVAFRTFRDGDFLY